MKILWIADMDTTHHAGGAQQSDKLHIDYGRNHGIDITKCIYTNQHRCKITPNSKNEYNYIITGNVYLWSHTPGFLDWIHSLNNHIRLEHDANAYLSQQQRNKLYKNNKLSLFLSKAHHQYFINTYGNLYQDIKSIIIPDPIDITIFYNFKQKRKQSLLWAGLLHPLKGLNILKQRATQGEYIDIAAIGNMPLIQDIIQLPNITLLGPVPHRDMPQLYNQYLTLLCAPQQLEPFCRTVGEALCCGMQIDTANSPYPIGSLQLYNKTGYTAFQEACATASQQLWHAIESY